MSIPTFDAFTRPILGFLAAQGGEAGTSAIFEHCAAWAKLSDVERAQRLSRGQPTYKNRVGWALTWLKHAQLVENPARATWRITDTGRQRLATKGPITAAELRPIVVSRIKGESEASPASSKSAPIGASTVGSATPEEQIQGAIELINASLSADLLQRLRNGSPEFFERAVLELLRAMGYVGEGGTVDHLGGSGDGGIDGVLYLDRLGLERVHVQAKRWQAPVGASVVRDFAGAMDVQGATKGVIVTPGAFSSAAVDYVGKSPKLIRLVQGDELAALMIEFGVGVSREQTVVLPRIDLDFFEE